VTGISLSLEAELAASRLAGAETLLVVSHFDGILAELASDPSDAVPLAGAVEVLSALAALPATSVAVVSGRSLQGLEDRTSWPPQIELIGSHGLEWSSGLTMGLTSEASSRLQRLVRRAREIAREPGVVLESKPFGVAIHYRQTDPAVMLGLVTRLTAMAAEEGDVHLVPGPRVLELAVTPLADGWALDVLRQRAASAAIVYVGDDETDDVAREALGPDDVVITVGSVHPHAAVGVESPAAVVKFLEHLYRQRRLAAAGAHAPPSHASSP
jgi:trehalose 6-phosphate phosphatase